MAFSMLERSQQSGVMDDTEPEIKTQMSNALLEPRIL
jgi:hypothetical protein